MVQRPGFGVEEAVSPLLGEDLVPALVQLLIDTTGQQFVCGGEHNISIHCTRVKTESDEVASLLNTCDVSIPLRHSSVALQIGSDSR